jgi:PAS domain S-box-containing protein
VKDPIPKLPATVTLPSGESGSLYQLLVETVRDYAIFALDPTGHIITWNPGAERFNGYTREEILGRHFSVFYTPDEADTKPPMELAVAEREGRVEDEGWRVRKDGSKIWANVVITALRDRSGRLVGFAKVTRDLTERKRAEEKALADATRLAEVEAANRAKAEFLAAMSHELRTPLNAIGGYADLLKLGVRGKLNEAQLEDIERIIKSQRHLLGIINDLLNFSRIEAGKIVYELEPVNLGQVIESVALMVSPLAAAKNIRLSTDGCEAETIAIADRAKVEQIVINLASNAVSYTEADGWLSLSCGTDGDMVWAKVSDNGIGISPDKLDAIFEPFVQVGRTLSTGHHGTGLGLAISRDLAKGMRGDLSVVSTLGEGSTFTLSLPGRSAIRQG